MITPSDALNRRIASRFLADKARRCGEPECHDVFFELSAPRTHIPDDIVLECSDGCTLTTDNVERMLPALKVVPGSCRFVQVTADAVTNQTKFQVTTKDGRRVTGTVTVNLVASSRRLDAFTVVDVDQ